MKQDDLRAAAFAAMENAYAPYSGYRVGCAVLADDECVYAGCNVENASYGATSCAERNAVGAAIAGGAKRICAVYIAGEGAVLPLPCGICRQVLTEFAAADTPIAAEARGVIVKKRLSELLPEAFCLNNDR